MKKVVQDLTSGGIDWQREKWQSGLGSKFIHQGEKNAAKYADEVIVLSKGVQDYFKETYPPKRVNRPEACGLRHLAFCVDSVEQTVRELAEVGIECEPIRVDEYTGKKMTFFHDPDGLPLELHE